MFRIYYADGTMVEGSTAKDWRAAPRRGVQVVVDLQPPPRPFPKEERFTSGIVGCTRIKPDATFYTGVDVYDLGFGQPKLGELLDDSTYAAIWERAFADH